MGFPRLSLAEQSEMSSKLIMCIPGKPESHQDKILLMVLPLLGEIPIPQNPADRKHVLGLSENPASKKLFLSLLQDVLLLPYGVNRGAELPNGLSPYAFKRLTICDWKAEELEIVKKGVVKFLCSAVLSDRESFTLLVLASADTRFSVATPALAESGKIATTLDFTDPKVTAPFYSLFVGNGYSNAEKKTTPCNARVRQKLLYNLIKARGKGINTVKGIQVIFEGLFGENVSKKCKVLSLQFCENLIKDGASDVLATVGKVIHSGLTKLIGRDSVELNEVQNAAYSALAQLARTCPFVFNKDLKIVLSYFNHIMNANPELHSSIREALIAIAPSFAWNYSQESNVPFVLTPQNNLLLALLRDNADSKNLVIQNATIVFLTTCYPEYFAPARFLLLLLAGQKNSLLESLTMHLYGVSKKDHITYHMLSSCEFPSDQDDSNKLQSEQKRVILPSFVEMIEHIWEVTRRRLGNPTQRFEVNGVKLPYSFQVYDELLEYLRLCLWYSAGIKAMPGNRRHEKQFQKYIQMNYKNSEENNFHRYLILVQSSIDAKRSEINLKCIYDLLNAIPNDLSTTQMHLLEPLANSLKDISESTRSHVAKIYGLLLAHGFNKANFEKKIAEIQSGLPNKTLEHRHGWILVTGHAMKRKLILLKASKEPNLTEWSTYVAALKSFVSTLCEDHPLIVSASVKAISLVGKVCELPNFQLKIPIEYPIDDDDKNYDGTDKTKYIIFQLMYGLLRMTNQRSKLREDAAYCFGYLAIGDGKFFAVRVIEKFMTLVKQTKDVSLNIAIGNAFAMSINGFDPLDGIPHPGFKNLAIEQHVFRCFLNTLIRQVADPNKNSRESVAVWLLAVVKNCGHQKYLFDMKDYVQMAFTELLSDESEFIQDVASRGLAMIYSMIDQSAQSEMANTLLDQMIGGKRAVKKLDPDTQLFPEGLLGTTPTGGNITTYKELCSLASDLNQPDMIYQFMQLANHNAAWTSKLGAAFGLKSISKEAKTKMQPFLGKIIPRLFRYKYDPTPKIQNSMISIWDSVVADPKDSLEKYYWDIMREILDNITFKEWRVRIACCLAVRDLLRRPNGLRLRSEEIKRKTPDRSSTVVEDPDKVAEPELRELWFKLFRVMDDIHEGTRMTAQGTADILSKICVLAASTDHGKSGKAVASSIIPLILNTGVTHTVPEIRRISMKTITELINSTGSYITPHLPTLIPSLLKATGELEGTKLSYLSTRLGADVDAQEVVDTLRAEAAKNHHTSEAISKCIRYVDITSLEKMTPTVLELSKTSVNLGTKIACAHFISLVSVRLGNKMTPLVSKYLGTCFHGINDPNQTVRKYYANSIGNLFGIAKEQSIKNLFAKLEEAYFQNQSNKGIPLAIREINNRHSELLKDYFDCVLPLVFFAMHETVSDENKVILDLWIELWTDISPGDAGISMNLHKILPQIEKNLLCEKWNRKIQSGSCIITLMKRLNPNVEDEVRLKLINLLLGSLQGRTFKSKEVLLKALFCCCQGLSRSHEICLTIVEAVMKECRKDEIRYKTFAICALGQVLEELEIDRWEELYNMTSNILDTQDYIAFTQKEAGNDSKTDLTPEDRNNRAELFNNLKESVCIALGRAWPKNSTETQSKYQRKFIEKCSQCLKDSTRKVQIGCLIALCKYAEKLKIFEAPEDKEENPEKKSKIDRNEVVDQIFCSILDAVIYALTIPHTGMKKESLHVILILIKQLTTAENTKLLTSLKSKLDETLKILLTDSSPEVRLRVKEIDDKLRNI